MSFLGLARSVVSPVGRAAPRLRSFATAQAENKVYLSEQEALQHHAAETTELWRKISYYVCVPAIATCVAWVYNAEVEHAAHLNHLKAENGGHLPEIPAFEYMNKRSKPFPWGLNSLFFNPHSNKDLTGEAE